MNLDILASMAVVVSFACTTEKYSNPAAGPGMDIQSEEHMEKVDPINDDADFKATGNEPFWSLEIDFDQTMHFKSLDHSNELITPVPKPEMAQDHNVQRYRAVTEQGEMIVSISKNTCTDTMSGEKSPFKVSVSVKLTSESEFREYEGCGSFQLDPRLHNIWALQEMEGEAVSASDFNQGAPTLEIFAAEGRVTGHDGCNQLFGQITGTKTKFKFGMIGSTMMACHNLEKSTQFQRLISDQSYDYNFDSGQLILSRNGQAVLKFRNVD